VNATLYYQSIQPYYLRQRSEDAHGPDTARLITFTNQIEHGPVPRDRKLETKNRNFRIGEHPMKDS